VLSTILPLGPLLFFRLSFGSFALFFLPVVGVCGDGGQIGISTSNIPAGNDGCDTLRGEDGPATIAGVSTSGQWYEWRLLTMTVLLSAQNYENDDIPKKKAWYPNFSLTPSAL